jgi:transcriptional regulator GlxA family with amidase domain
MPPQRSGGQAQYIRHASTPAELDDRRIADAMAWARRHLEQPIVVADLAARSHMSVRTFSRRFGAETGTTPLSWLLDQRLARACELLETTARPLAMIASTAGFGTVATMRYHFRNELSTSPSAYRATFSQRQHPHRRR